MIRLLHRVALLVLGHLERRLDPAEAHPRVHDDAPGIIGADAGIRHQLDQLVASEIGQILERLHTLAAELDDGRERQAIIAEQVLAQTQLGGLGAQILLDLIEIGLGPLLERLGDLLVEAGDAGQLLGLGVGDVLDRGEALGDQELGDDLLDIQAVHEHLGQVAELALAPLAVVSIGNDVDVPAGQLRGEAHVLAAPADRDVLLLIGDNDLDALRVRVQHHLADLSRGQRVDDEGGRVGRPRDDVDLLAAQLLDHRLDTAAAHTDAGAHRVDAAVLGLSLIHI